ncbi:MAG: hypothetical protein ACI4M5_03170 [Christensenellales bacterium]
MKKSALYSTIVMIVVIVCCITAVTFSFFSIQSSNNIFELGSKVSEKFVVAFSESGNQIISGDAIKTDGSVESGGQVARLVLTYTTQTAYANMYFTVSNLQYNVPTTGSALLAAGNTTIVEPTSANARYMDSVIQYAFVKVGKDEAVNSVSPPAEESKWYYKQELSTDCFELATANGSSTGISKDESGTIILFLRISPHVNNELLPPAMHQVEVVATIESREL